MSAAALWAWLCGRPVLAAGSLGLATSARMLSGSLSAAVVGQWAWDVARRRRRPRHATWLVAQAGLFGVGLFYAYLGDRFGDPLAQMKTQASWGRKPASFANLCRVVTIAFNGFVEEPLQVVILAGLVVWLSHRPLRRLLASAFPRAEGTAVAVAPILLWANVAYLLGLIAWDPVEFFGKGYDRILHDKFLDVAIAVVLGSLGVRAWFRRGPFWGILVLAPILMVAATGSLMSLGRLAMGSYPAFIEAAEVFEGRVSFPAAIVFSLALQLLLIYNYVNWSFSG